MEIRPHSAPFRKKKFRLEPGMCWCGHTWGLHTPIPAEPAVHSMGSSPWPPRWDPELKQLIERTEAQVGNEQELYMCMDDDCICTEFKTAFQEESTDIDLEGELDS